jgi:hypothetical protein
MDMKKRKSIRKKAITECDANALAEQYRTAYDAFLQKGFTSEEAFQLLLVVAKKSV